MIWDRLSRVANIIRSVPSEQPQDELTGMEAARFWFSKLSRFLCYWQPGWQRFAGRRLFHYNPTVYILAQIRPSSTISWNKLQNNMVEQNAGKCFPNKATAREMSERRKHLFRNRRSLHSYQRHCSYLCIVISLLKNMLHISILLFTVSISKCQISSSVSKIKTRLDRIPSLVSSYVAS